MQARGPPALGRVFLPLQFSAGLLGRLPRAFGLASCTSGQHVPWGLRRGGHGCPALVVGGLRWGVFSRKCLGPVWGMLLVVSRPPGIGRPRGGPRQTSPALVPRDKYNSRHLFSDCFGGWKFNIKVSAAPSDPSFSVLPASRGPPLFLGCGHLIPTSAPPCVFYEDPSSWI